MSHVYEECYEKAKKFDGGVIRFINILDKYHYDYELHCRKKGNQVTIYIYINEKRFKVSDRNGGKKCKDSSKRDRLARVTIPKTHSLSKNYKDYNGFLQNENEDIEVTETDKEIYVFFRPEDFEGVIKEIYKKD